MFVFCKKCQENTERYNNGKCKRCFRASIAKYYSDNPEKKRDADAKYRNSNPEKTKARKAAYRATHLEGITASSVAYRAANQEKIKEGKEKYYAANKEKIMAYKSAWRKSNPEVVRVHSQNRRSRKLANGGKLSKGLPDKLFKLQKGRCPCCGQPLGDNYHLDHVIPLAHGGANEDWNIQLLRQQCNNQKGVKNQINFMQSRGFLL